MPFIPDSIYQIRKSLGHNGRKASRFYLAKELGCTEKTIMNWENNKSSPSLKMLDRLAELCSKEKIEKCEVYEIPKDAGEVMVFRTRRKV